MRNKNKNNKKINKRFISYNYVYNKHNINVVEKLDRNFAISECKNRTITLTNN